MSLVAVNHLSQHRAGFDHGETVIAPDDGASDFLALRSRRRNHEPVLYAFRRDPLGQLDP